MILSLIYIYLLVTFNYGYAKVNYRNSNVTINLSFSSQALNLQPRDDSGTVSNYSKMLDHMNV